MRDPSHARLAVILAAGGGARMGQPKGLLMLRGRPLVLHHVAALQPFAERVVVVTGAERSAHDLALVGIDAVHNPDWAATWPADSLRLALQTWPGPGRVLTQPVDTPPAAPETCQALLHSPGSCVPMDGSGRPGHPVLLSQRDADAVRVAAPKGGLRTLLIGAARVSVDQVDVGLDFDTWAEWTAFREGIGDG